MSGLLAANDQNDLNLKITKSFYTDWLIFPSLDNTMHILIDMLETSSLETGNVSTENSTYGHGIDAPQSFAVSSAAITGITDVGLHLEAVAVLALFITSIVINCLMFLLFLRKPSLVTLSNRFVLNLGMCNVLNTFSTMPVVFVSLVSKEWVFSAPWCQVTGFLTSTTFTANTLTIVMISVDRYCAVLYPLQYKIKVTSLRVWLMIVAVWTVAVGASIPPLLGWNRYAYHPEKFTCSVSWQSRLSHDQYYTLFLFFLGLLFPLLVISVTYSMIFRAAMHNSRRTSRSNSAPPSLTEVTVDSPLSKKPLTDSRVSLVSTKQWLMEKSPRSAPRHFRQEVLRTARTTFIVIFSFILCWFPFYLCSLLEGFLPEDRAVPVFILHVCFLLAMCSAVVTPMVYVFRNRVIRKEMERTFSPKMKEPPKLSSLYARRIMNTKVVVTRGTSVEHVTEKETPGGKMAFTNDGFVMSKSNFV